MTLKKKLRRIAVVLSLCCLVEVLTYNTSDAATFEGAIFYMSGTVQGHTAIMSIKNKTKTRRYATLSMTIEKRTVSDAETLRSNEYLRVTSDVVNTTSNGRATGKMYRGAKKSSGVQSLKTIDIR